MDEMSFVWIEQCKRIVENALQLDTTSCVAYLWLHSMSMDFDSS